MGGTTVSPLPQAAKIFTLPVNPSLGRIVFPRKSFLPAFHFFMRYSCPYKLTLAPVNI